MADSPNGNYTKRFYVAVILFAFLMGLNTILILRGDATGLAPFSEIAGAVLALLGMNKIGRPPGAGSGNPAPAPPPAPLQIDPPRESPASQTPQT